MQESLWFMRGVSSQRDLILGVKQEKIKDVSVIASHSQERNEILSVADIAYKEPENKLRMDFIANVVEKNNVKVIQTGLNTIWHEERRKEIESLGVKLVTGALSVDTHNLADNKDRFSRFMRSHGIPVVDSILISTPEELLEVMGNNPFEGKKLCIKPTIGIYGGGFWKLDYEAEIDSFLNETSDRRIRPDIYLNAIMRSKDNFESKILMPCLEGAETSVDMIVENGEVILAIGRKKRSHVQDIFIEGEEIELAISCASLMKSDGIVNVQTISDGKGNTSILETNLRPSGGVCFSRHCGINIPGIFAKRQLGMISKNDAKNFVKNNFNPVSVRILSDSIKI